MPDILGTVTVNLKDYTDLVYAKGLAEGRLLEQKTQVDTMFKIIEEKVPNILDQFSTKIESWSKLFS